MDLVKYNLPGGPISGVHYISDDAPTPLDILNLTDRNRRAVHYSTIRPLAHDPEIVRLLTGDRDESEPGYQIAGEPEGVREESGHLARRSGEFAMGMFD